MRTKKFIGKDLRETLGKVKVALGPDAVILSTREVRKSRGAYGLFEEALVEVEASGQMPHEAGAATGYGPHPFAAGSAAPRERLGAGGVLRTKAPASAALAPGWVGGLEPPSDIWSLYAELCEAGLDAESAWEIVSRASALSADGGPDGPSALRADVGMVLGHLIETCGPVQPRAEGAEGPAVVNFIGPTGAGKTTTIAKIAAECTYGRRLKVGLMTLDTYRVGAIEQLKVYAGFLRLPLIVARSVEEMDRGLRRFREADVVLVDTAGRSLRDEPRMAELTSYFGEGRPGANFLVLAANTHPRDVLRMGERFSCVPLDGLVFTKLDEGSRFGVIFQLHMELGVPIAYLTAGQKVPQDLDVATPETLAELILPRNREIPAPKGAVA